MKKIMKLPNQTLQFFLPLLSFSTYSTENLLMPTVQDMEVPWKRFWNYFSKINAIYKASFQKKKKNDGEFVIAICTPIMQRAVELLPQSNEIIFVDASSNMDKDNHRFFFS